ncbi:putative 39S ribosomal protein L45, mitochondrial [Orchesella cincta]|uniref:Large ribosomal subunit protein mL45 n=1 Tax=Orchesella cincta TaxID=48709 RepID=A0A1D2NIH7_ORCCI|nr:putative 39S ribosomal protein L45, mitochondrial [Orchesella cincta]
MIAFREVVRKNSLLLTKSNSYLFNSLGYVAPNAAFIGQDYKIQVRFGSTKHWNPKWKPFRRLKVIKVDLPDFNEAAESKNYSPDEVRAKMKERGMSPPRPWMERPFEISSTSDIFEPYVPPEGDGKASYISKEGAKQSAEMVSKKSKTWLAFRKIRNFDEDFEGKHFAAEAQKIYLNVHKAVSEKDKNTLRVLVTEKAYPEVTLNMRSRTIVWNFLDTIEEPRVVHARCTDVIQKENVFAQITCRFFTKQSLAIYDRFGRLAHGSEVVAKDVLEYVVFEKHLANQYGEWRVHGKIIPEWAPTNFETSYRTFRMSN